MPARWPTRGAEDCHDSFEDKEHGTAAVAVDEDDERKETDGLISSRDSGGPESEQQAAESHATCGTIFRKATDATFAGIVTLYSYTLRPVVRVFAGGDGASSSGDGTSISAAGPSTSVDSPAGVVGFHPGTGYEPVSPITAASPGKKENPIVAGASPGPSSSPHPAPDAEIEEQPLVSHERIVDLTVLQQRLAVLSAVCPVRCEAESGGGDGGGSSSPNGRGRVLVNLSLAINTLPADTSLETREDALREMEEVLLGDADESYLLLCTLHVLDVSFASPQDTMTLMSWGSARHNDSSLDLHHQATRAGGGDAANGAQHVQLTTEDHVALHQRIITFVNNLIEAVAKASSSVRLTFTRCDMTPTALVETLFLPASGLRYLSFSRCPFTDAHVHALLRRARRTDSLFSSLRFLQLSGTISRDAVNLLLRFMDEEVDNPVLGELVVPQSLADCANSHPLSLRLPNLMVNGRRIAGK